MIILHVGFSSYLIENGPNLTMTEYLSTFIDTMLVHE